jgi:predicted transcriptional regulator
MELKIESCPNFVEFLALAKLRETFHKWFKYEDETLLDLCLAVAIHSRYLKTRWLSPLWLMIISASGQRKSRTVDAFLESQKTYLMNQITANTFISGWKKQSESDLCNRLKDEDIRLIVTSDMSQFIKMPYEVKSAVWSQLRDGYYGRFQKKTGSGVDVCYEGVLFDWLACSTYVIDEDLIMKDQLGSRELCLRIPDENEEPEEREKLMMKVWENSGSEKEREFELKQAVNEYFAWWEQNRTELSQVTISDEIRNRIFKLAFFITQLRATAESDPKTGDLLNFVYPEAPTRILEQLKMMFIHLKQITFNYSDEDAMARLFEITKSSIHPVRLKILKTLYEHPEGLSTTKISRKVDLQFAVTKRELNICHQLGIVERTEQKEQGGDAFIWTIIERHDIFEQLPNLCKDLEKRIEPIKPTVQTQIIGD